MNYGLFLVPEFYFFLDDIMHFMDMLNYKENLALKVSLKPEGSGWDP